MRIGPDTRAVLQALFVTFLWSTSWVLIKIGLDDIPALTFAGLRYVLAFVVLVPIAARREFRRSWRALDRSAWWKLGALGMLMYSVTQGAQFLGLVYLPATTASLVLSFSPVAVALLGAVTIRERPSLGQWIGTGVYLAGAWLYFHPVRVSPGELTGIAIVLVGVAGNAGAAVLGRAVQRDGRLPAVVVTAASMGIGSVVLLAVGIAAQGLPAMSLASWAIVVWLAVVNTAFAFTLWNVTLRVLPALTSSLVNNTMLIQIAVLAWLFLGERLGVTEIVGLSVAAAGVLATQVARRRAMVRAGPS